MNCEKCGGALDREAFWRRYGVRVATCHQCGHTYEVPREPETRKGPAVIDDTLPGGARWMQNLGHQPIWIETKTELQKELDRRGFQLKESANRQREDKSPWATRTRRK